MKEPAFYGIKKNWKDDEFTNEGKSRIKLHIRNLVDGA